ncbi:TPA: hypothetical protein DD712_01435 [Candidatus Acetothermia bacterium]|nr:hypothetical protein [Candidatus Acetothermia bacterium]
MQRKQQETQLDIQAEIYACVSKRDIGRIQSPLDSLAAQEKGKTDEGRWRPKEGIREVVRLTC